MSNFWPIQGIGLKVEEEYLDWKKCLEFLRVVFDIPSDDIEDIKTQEELEEFLFNYDIHFNGLIEVLVKNYNNRHIECIDGGNSGEGTYILFTPGYPWHFTEEDLNITMDKIAEMVYECIKPVLKDTYTKEEIITKIDYVATYGCDECFY